MATELGQAYVQIIPSAKGISGAIQRQLDPEASAAGTSAGNKIGASLKVAAVAAVAAAGVVIGKTVSSAISEGANLEQSLGGIDTLFKGSANKVKKYADDAFKTAGLSANDYMTNVTSFSASLLQSMGGDTEKAADTANMAMVDMSDNANKMGTDMQDIQNAYQGFAKQNYTMLDNLKLGYGGTKQEMQRLLSDAQKLTGVKYNINNLGDVYNAIHAVQEKLDITGTTAKEAAETLSGSLASMKSAYANVLGKIAIGEDIKNELNALAQTTSTFLFGNFIPMLTNIFKALPSAIMTFISEAGPLFFEEGNKLIESLGAGMSSSGNSPFLWLQNSIKWISVYLTQMVKEVSTRMDSVISVFEKLKTGIEPVLNAIAGIISGWSIAVAAVLSTAIPLAIDILTGVFGGFLDFILPIFESLSKVIWDFSSRVTEAILNYVVPALQSMIDWISNNQELVAEFGRLLGAVAVGFAVFKTISAVVTVFNSIKTAIMGVSLAFKGMALAMAANPFTLIIAAISALVAGFVYLWQTNEGFKNAVIEIWNAILAFLQPIITAIKDFIMATWGPLFQWWNTNHQMFFETVSTIWNAILAFLQPILTAIKDFIMITWGTLSEWWNANQQMILETVTMVWNSIKEVFNVVLQAISLIVTTVLTAIKSFWDTWGQAITAAVQVMWAYVSMVFQTTLNTILNVVTMIFNQIGNVIKLVMDVIKNITKIVLSAIKGDWDGVLQGIQGIVSAFGDFIKNTFNNIMNTGKDIVKSGIDNIKNFFSTLGDINLLDAGRAVIDGFVNGLKGAWEAGKDFIGGIGDWIAENKGPIEYDRKLLIPAGSAIMGGFNESLQESFRAVQATIRSVGPSIKDSMLDTALNDIIPNNAVLAASTELSVSQRFGGTDSGNNQSFISIIQRLDEQNRLLMGILKKDSTINIDGKNITDEVNYNNAIDDNLKLFGR
ncbi:phage tail protein [Vagococcus carniphilus]|uniref:phage tail protein n=1 Tax=Vagococcus carniphilus TaxID=218144 RepID=UPI002890E14A|nr:phage tail protein [Vagococcus carniphilus]MDT2848758.1 phage tail protein [Vagococcus carniphilus]